MDGRRTRDIRRTHRQVRVLSSLSGRPHRAVSKGLPATQPGPRMITDLAARYDVDLKRSFLIGDKDRDLEAAHRAGIPGYLFEGGNLCTFVNLLLNRHPARTHRGSRSTHGSRRGRETTATPHDFTRGSQSKLVGRIWPEERGIADALAESGAIARPIKDKANRHSPNHEQ